MNNYIVYSTGQLLTYDIVLGFARHIPVPMMMNAADTITYDTNTNTDASTDTSTNAALCYIHTDAGTST